MKILTLSFALCMILAVGLFPAESEMDISRAYPESKSLYNFLIRMPLEEKLNAEIKLALPDEATAVAENISRKIEFKWNNGRHDDALGLIDGLAKQVDINRVGVDINWLEPVLTSQPESSYDCYRISNYDSIRVVDYDIDRSTGNMIAVLLRDGDNWNSVWTVHFSTDGGQYWSQTFEHGSPYYISDVDCATCGDHSLVAFTAGNGIIVYWFQMSDGAQINFPSGASSVTALSAGEQLEELDLVSTEDFDNTQEYAYYLAANSVTHSIYLRQACYVAETWNTIPATIPEDVDRGIDLALNEVGGGFGGHYGLFLSFLSTDQVVYVYGYRPSVLEWHIKLGRYVYSDEARFSSIDAYEDDVYLIYDAVYSEKICMVSYSVDGGINWNDFGIDNPSHPQCCPGITAHSGSGLAFCYRIYIANPPIYVVTGRLQWGDYNFAYWHSPVSYMSTPANDVKPAIDALPDGHYGILGVQSSGTARHLAFFCITESCCLKAGDANGDNDANIGDAVYLINYVFKGGPAPHCLPEGDANCDGGVNVGDAVYIISYVFKGGPEPCCP